MSIVVVEFRARAALVAPSTEAPVKEEEKFVIKLLFYGAQPFLSFFISKTSKLPRKKLFILAPVFTQNKINDGSALPFPFRLVCRRHSAIEREIPFAIKLRLSTAWAGTREGKMGRRLI